MHPIPPRVSQPPPRARPPREAVRVQKIELLQLHALLTQIRSHFAPTERDAFLEYDAQATRPLSLQHSKRQHLNAVLLLAASLATAIQGRTHHPLASSLTRFAKTRRRASKVEA